MAESRLVTVVLQITDELDSRTHAILSDESVSVPDQVRLCEVRIYYNASKSFTLTPYTLIPYTLHHCSLS